MLLLKREVAWLSICADTWSLHILLWKLVNFSLAKLDADGLGIPRKKKVLAIKSTA